MQGSWRGGQVHQARISTGKKANTLVIYEWMGVWAGLDAGSNLLKITDYLARFPSCYPSREPSLPSCTGEGRVVGFQSWLNCTRTRLVHTVLVSRVGGGGSMSLLADGKVTGECQGPTSAGSTRQQGKRSASQHTSEQLAWHRHVTREGLSISMLKRSSCRGHNDVPRSSSRTEWAWTILKVGIIPPFYRSFLCLALGSVYCRSRASL